MNLLDIVILGILVGAVVLEIKRGFGRSLFDLAALLVAVRAAPMLIGPISCVFRLACGGPADKAAVYATSFVLVGGILIFLGRLLYSSTLISAEVFEPLLGGLCGIAIGMILCHAIVRTLTMSVMPHSDQGIVLQSALGGEFLNFGTYHHILETLYNFDRTDKV